MESTNKKQPLFWINPNTRINFPHFRIEWHRCEKYELLALCEVKQECGTIYKAGSNCVCLLHSRDFSIVHILYSDDVDFTNIRLQKWFRENIRNAIVERAKIVLPQRLHELETRHQLYAKCVIVKKLRKGTLGRCSVYKQIWLSPLIVIFPQELMDGVILHEMAHLKHLNHRKPFWDFLSILIGTDAKEQKMIENMALSKYWELYVFLMK